MEAEPMVSVLMPTYNSRRYVSQAVESVMAQTYPHFELLVVDDGSTDGTLNILEKFARSDRRVRVIPREHNGLVGTLNFGLQQANGRYLARLDADDLAAPQRLEQQVRCLEADAELVIAGSAYTLIDDLGAPIQVHTMPLSDTAIRWHDLFHSPFAHPSVILRLETVRENGLRYDPAMKEAEDYELWSRLLQHGRGCNLAEPLVEYRVHPAQASQQGQAQVWEHASRVSQKNLIALGAPLPIEQVHRLRRWYYHFPRRFNATDLPLAEALLLVLNRFSLQPGLDVDEVRRLRGRWLGRLLRAGGRSGDVGWNLRQVRQLTREDFSAVKAYLRMRETQENQ